MTTTSTQLDLIRQGGANVNFCDGSLLFLSNTQLGLINPDWRAQWADRGCMPIEFRDAIIAGSGVATKEVTADSQFVKALGGTQLTPGEIVTNSGERTYTELPYVEIANADPRASSTYVDNSPPPGAVAMPTGFLPTTSVPMPSQNLTQFGDLSADFLGITDIFNVAKKIGQAVGLLPNGSGGGGGGGTQVLPFQPITGSCPTGYRLDSNGRCVQEGLGGTIARTLPGGNTGVLGQGGQAVIGAFGTPGMLPAQVGVINNRPILRCPRAMVLGADDVCYAKGSLPRQFRKWKPATRPAVSGGDVRAIRQAASAKNRVKKLAQNVGFSVANKGARRSCAPRKK